MPNRRTTFTNIKGHKEEFSSEDLNMQNKYYGREAKIQKSKIPDYEKNNFIGSEKGAKIPIKHKMT